MLLSVPGFSPRLSFIMRVLPEENPFNFVSYPISCNLGEVCPPEVPYYQDANSMLEAQVQVMQHEAYHSGLVDLYQESQIQALRKEVEELKSANQELAHIGIKMWVSNAIVHHNLEELIQSHCYPLLQSLRESLIASCPSSLIGPRGSPAASKASLPHLENAFPSSFFKSGFISREPSPS